MNLCCSSTSASLWHAARHALTSACCRFQAESRQHRLLFRATFGTQHSSQMANLLDIIPKNVANTNVLVWAGRCLVLFEAGQPYRLDARSLQTQGVDLLGGAVRPGVPFALGTPALDKAAGQRPAALHSRLLLAKLLHHRLLPQGP